MANMSYCRFENTADDLEECYRALCDGEAEDEDLSSREREAKARVIKMCQLILEQTGQMPPDADLQARVEESFRIGHSKEGK